MPGIPRGLFKGSEVYLLAYQGASNPWLVPNYNGHQGGHWNGEVAPSAPQQIAQVRLTDSAGSEKVVAC